MTSDEYIHILGTLCLLKYYATPDLSKLIDELIGEVVSMAYLKEQI